MPDAVFRFDASASLGFGHAVRCSALAGHFGALGWRTVAAMREGAGARGPWMDAFDRVVALSGSRETEDLHEMSGGACNLLVVDHYDWDARLERRCRAWAKRIAVIDDLANRDHDCDLLCDSGPGRTTGDYAGRVPGGAAILPGPCYAVLRPEFAKARHRLAGGERQTVQRLFVNVGATDPTGLLPTIVDGIEQSEFAGIVDIMIASQAPGRSAIAHKLDGAGFDGRLHVDVQDVAGLMAGADLAIGAAGTTAWERCCLRLPSLVVIAAENQRHNAQGLSEAGAVTLVPQGFSASDIAAALAPLLENAGLRAGMARRAGRLCDGLGCGRLAEVAAYGTSDTQGAPIRLRPVGEGDRDIVLQWQREPGAREFSRNPRSPGETEHAAWFAARLDDPACVFHIVEAENAPAGFVRLDFRHETETYEVSIVVARAFHGRGIASGALGVIRRMLPWGELVAWVRPGNVASVGLFRKADYVEASAQKNDGGIWLTSLPLADGRHRQFDLADGVTP